MKSSQLVYSLLIFLLLTTISGCDLFSKQAVPPPPVPEFFNHTVTFPGETLTLISKWYSGSAKNWKIIDAANPKLKAQKIQINDVVHIPIELVTNKVPMPKSFITRFTEKVKESRSTKSASISKNKNNPHLEEIDELEEVESLTIEMPAPKQLTDQGKLPPDTISTVGDSSQEKHDELIQKLLQ